MERSSALPKQRFTWGNIITIATCIVTISVLVSKMDVGIRVLQEVVKNHETRITSLEVSRSKREAYEKGFYDAKNNKPFMDAHIENRKPGGRD